MQKTVVRNPNQSPIRRNILNIAGIVVQGETIAPQNGDRLLGGYGVAWLNNQDAASQTTGQDNPLPECNCESGGGGGGSGGGVQPSGNCEKKNISELKQVLDDYAAQSFCDKEFPEVQFSTFIGYDKQPSDSTAKEIELRMLCPSDECVEPNYVLLIEHRKIECTGASTCPDSCVKIEYEFEVVFSENEVSHKERRDSVFANAHTPCWTDSFFWTADFAVLFYLCSGESYQLEKQCDNGNTCSSGDTYIGFCEAFEINGVNGIRVYNGKNMNNKSKDEIIEAVTNGVMSKNGVDCITVKMK